MWKKNQCWSWSLSVYCLASPSLRKTRDEFKKQTNKKQKATNTPNMILKSRWYPYFLKLPLPTPLAPIKRGEKLKEHLGGWAIQTSGRLALQGALNRDTSRVVNGRDCQDIPKPPSPSDFTLSKHWVWGVFTFEKRFHVAQRSLKLTM